MFLPQMEDGQVIFVIPATNLSLAVRHSLFFSFFFGQCLCLLPVVVVTINRKEHTKL